MYFIDNQNINPYFNIALEEYLLKDTSNEYMVLYSDAPSVIVGKHQNTLAEINYRFITENNIAVVRRISGGGTVYHDAGNLNFAFIANSREGHQIDFKKYTLPAIKAIQGLGIDAKLEGKNDIRVNGLKISGNAEHVFKNRILHHGTLLVNADLQQLSAALKNTGGKYTDNAVKSIRSNVCNLSSLNNNITVSLLKQLIVSELEQLTHIEHEQVSEAMQAAVNQRCSEKFSQWQWNFAYSPRYEFNNHNNEFPLHFVVEEGMITNVIKSPLGIDIHQLKGMKHEVTTFRAIAQQLDTNNNISVWDLAF